MSTTATGPTDPDTSAGPASDDVRVRRRAERGAYDRATIHAILDEAITAHVGLVANGRPVVIPMIFGRDGDDVYLHGSVASRLLRSAGSGIDVCLTATLIDGLVMSRSAFHHSMTYRSVVVLGRAEVVEGDEALHGVRVIAEHLTPGRWDEVRAPSPSEMRQTMVLRLSLAEASAKIRDAGPGDEPEDLASPVWAGVVPLERAWGEPVPDAALPAGTAPSASVLALTGTPRERTSST